MLILLEQRFNQRLFVYWILQLAMSSRQVNSFVTHMTYIIFPFHQFNTNMSKNLRKICNVTITSASCKTNNILNVQDVSLVSHSFEHVSFDNVFVEALVSVTLITQGLGNFRLKSQQDFLKPFQTDYGLYTLQVSCCSYESIL